MWYVYVITSCKDNRLYVGMSEEPTERLRYHNAGKVKSTQPYCPWEIVWIEELGNSAAARKREKYLKSGYGKLWLRKKLGI